MSQMTRIYKLNHSEIRGDVLYPPRGIYTSCSKIIKIQRGMTLGTLDTWVQEELDGK